MKDYVKLRSLAELCPAEARPICARCRKPMNPRVGKFYFPGHPVKPPTVDEMVAAFKRLEAYVYQPVPRSISRALNDGYVPRRAILIKHSYRANMPVSKVRFWTGDYQEYPVSLVHAYVVHADGKHPLKTLGYAAYS